MVPVGGLLLKKSNVGKQNIVPRIASKINNLVICYFPSFSFFHSVSFFTKIVGITNPNPPIAVHIKEKREVTKVRWFSFHQIEEILADELNNIG